MAEILDESTNLESHTVGIYRTASTVKGGRRFSFGALVVVGDRRGKVGYGYAKSPEVPTAIEKAQKRARQTLISVPMAGTTFPHEIEGRSCASTVRLMPASPGTGVVAGGTVRAVMEIAGISDCLTKCTGSTSKLNTVRAVLDGLSKLRTREEIAELRGVEITTSDIEQRIERGSKFMPAKIEGSDKMAAPVNTVGQDRGGRGGRGGGGRGGRGGGRGGRGGGYASAAPEAPAGAESNNSGGESTQSSES